MRMRLEGGGGMTESERRWRPSASLLLAAALVGGCRKADPVAALKERASTYWGLKQSKGWPEVYDSYLDPDAKKTVTREAFLKRRWLAFDILSYRNQRRSRGGRQGHRDGCQRGQFSAQDSPGRAHVHQEASHYERRMGAPRRELVRGPHRMRTSDLDMFQNLGLGCAAFLTEGVGGVAGSLLGQSNSTITSDALPSGR